MAKPLTSMKPVGVFFALNGQNTTQAPVAKSEPSGKVYAGMAYAVFIAIKHDNILWLLLDSLTPGKPEWARADMDTNTGTLEYGAYLGPVYGQQ